MSNTETFALTPFPVLRTQRLVLREFTPVDAAAVLVFRGDPLVQKYNSDPLRSMSEVAAFLEELNAEQATQTGLSWAVTLGEGQPVIGLAGLYFWDKFHRRAELGYDLAHPYWGRGIGSEAAAEIVRFGF
jgi:[ribosomal protein S5]-alanine N-acetyltransferase